MEYALAKLLHYYYDTDIDKKRKLHTLVNIGTLDPTYDINAMDYSNDNFVVMET